MNAENKNALLWASNTIRTALNEASDTIDALARDARRNGEDEYRHILAVVNALDYLADALADADWNGRRPIIVEFADGVLLLHGELAREDAEAESEKERKADARANERALQTAPTEKEAANVR